MRTTVKAAAHLSAALLLAGGLVACGNPQEEKEGGSSAAGDCPAAASEEISDTIKLGSTMPLSGQLASVGQNQVGVQAYVDYINANGGVDGRQLELTVLDDKGDPAIAVANVQKLISQENIDALVAVTTTPVNLAVSKLAEEQCVPSLFALTGDARFTGGQFKGVIPATDPYDSQAKALVEDIVAEAGEGATVAVIQTESDSGAGLSESLAKAAEEAGIEVVDTQKVAPTETTPPNSQVQAIANKADVVVLLTSPFQCPPALQAIARSGWKPKVYSSDFCAYPSVLQPAGDLANGVRSVNWVVDPTDPSNADREDVKAYLDAVEGKAEAPAVTSFAETGWVSAAGAVALLKEVAEDGELTRVAVIDATNSFTDLDIPLLYDGITASTTKGNVSPWNAFNVVEYRDGHYTSVRQVAAK